MIPLVMDHAKGNGVMSDQVGFSYGALSHNLEDQAKTQGYTLGKAGIELQRCVEAILVLRFGIDTPEAVHQKLLERLHKKVIKSLKKLKEMEEENEH